jgi:hypothetical protein
LKGEVTSVWAAGLTPPDVMAKGKTTMKAAVHMTVAAKPTGRTMSTSTIMSGALAESLAKAGTDVTIRITTMNVTDIIFFMQIPPYYPASSAACIHCCCSS